MKIHPFALLGAFLMILGIASLIHPNLAMPAKKTEVQIGSTKAIMETRRIIEVPAALAGFLIFSGGALGFLGVWQPWARNSSKRRK